ncbi:MAG TPA: hypothetical protein VK986_01220 [Tepidisphaeraceae bacterium]|nr:hypothetical protein [Tepidisphaeraceae bacterium]
MLTDREILLSSAVPILVAAVIALVGYWRRWAWAGAVAAGSGFLVAYGAQFAREPRWFVAPPFPPHDGTDWVFWSAVPLTALGVGAALVRGWWGVIGGLAAGSVAYMVLWPVVKSGAVPHGAALADAAVVAGAGVLTVFAARFAAARVGGMWVVAALSVVAGGTGVLVMASGMKDVGLHGMAGGAAVFGAAVAALPRRGLDSSRVVTGIAVVATGIVGGLIAASRGYADPALPWSSAGVILASPVLLVIGAFIPGRRRWVAGAIALLAVAVAVGGIAGPAAAKAKRDAEAAKAWGY